MLIALLPAPGEHRLQLSTTTAVVPPPQPLAPASPPLLDLDGRSTRRPAVESHHERWAKILPDVPGLQRVAWNYTWTDQKVCRLQLFAYDQGFDRPRCVWETDPPEDTIFNPLNVVFDIDGDGVQEICVAAHYRVMIFEGTTGRKETELRYHASRPYGWFGLADVDADGQVELVTVGDFQSHIDVLEFDPQRPEAERLSVRWRRDIEQNIDERAKWPQVGPRPLADVTGDGRPEIVLNLFNDTGDNQWHAVALDAASGQAVCDLASRFVQGVADVDADGTAELFLTSTTGPLVHARGLIELVGLRDGEPTVRWSRPGAAWLSTDVPRLGPTWSTTAAQGMRHVLLTNGRETTPSPQYSGEGAEVRGEETPSPQYSGEGAGVRGGRPAFFVCTSQPGAAKTTTLTALRSREDGSWETVWQIDGLPQTIAADSVGWVSDPTGIAEKVKTAPTASTNPHPAALLRLQLAPQTTSDLHGSGVQPFVQENRPLGIDVSLPIAARLGSGEGVSAIVEAPGQQIAAITPPRGPGQPPTLRWQRPGRGMRDGSRVLGPLAADLDDDGACEVIAADQAEAGHAVLVAYRGDGTTMWQKAFEQVPGASPVWNVGALTFWWPGRFRRPDQFDLIVNTRRGFMHSDVGQLLDGREATTLWEQTKAVLPGQFHWGWGGAPLAVVDVDADQCDDLVCLHPVCFWIADGRDGRIKAGQELASRKVLPAWAAYGEPLVYDFNRDGQPEVLLDSPYLLALLDTNGAPLWHGLGRIDYPVKPGEGNLGETTRCKHALADIDGDGKFEIASAGYGNGMRLMEPLTGRLLWSLSAPEPTGPKVTAVDIDGQAGDELLYPAGATLVAITGDRTSGRILWTWQAPATLSLPAVADFDGDGSAEIVVQDASATLHCLDAPQSAIAK